MAPNSCSLENILFDPFSAKDILLMITLILTSNSVMIMTTFMILPFSPNEANDFLITFLYFTLTLDL